MELKVSLVYNAIAFRKSTIPAFLTENDAR